LSLRKLKILCDEIGATVEDQKIGMSHMCEVFSPKGKKFSCDGIHILCSDSYIPWKPDYKDLIKRINFGLEDCDDGPDCEWCYPEEE
jgi:hypothetical protein